MKTITEYIQKKHIEVNGINEQLFSHKMPEPKDRQSYLNIFFDNNANIDEDDDSCNLYIAYKDLYTIPINEFIQYVNKKADEIEDEYHCDVENISFCYYRKNTDYYCVYFIERKNGDKTQIQRDGGDKSKDFELIYNYFEKHVKKNETNN